MSRVTTSDEDWRSSESAEQLPDKSSVWHFWIQRMRLILRLVGDSARASRECGGSTLTKDDRSETLAADDSESPPADCAPPRSSSVLRCLVLCLLRFFLDLRPRLWRVWLSCASSGKALVGSCLVGGVGLVDWSCLAGGIEVVLMVEAESAGETRFAEVVDRMCSSRRRLCSGSLRMSNVS